MLKCREMRTRIQWPASESIAPLVWIVVASQDASVTTARLPSEFRTMLGETIKALLFAQSVMPRTVAATFAVASSGLARQRRGEV